MIRLVLATILGAALGLLAHRALSAENYLPMWRAATLGALLFGYLGTGWWVWMGTSGWMRWVLMIWMLLVLRIFYLPILEVSLWLTSWIELLGGKLGMPRSSILVHCGWGAGVAGLSALVALLASSVVIHLRRWIARIALIAILGQGAFALSHQEDRTLSPQPFSADKQAAGSRGPTYREAARSSDNSLRTRLVALVSEGVDAISPKTGWGGVVRETQREEFKRDPEHSSRDRVKAIEAAFVTARPYLQTSPDTRRRP